VDNSNSIVRRCVLVLLSSLLLSACQTIDDIPTNNSAWISLPSSRLNNAPSQPERVGGAPLLDNTRGGKSTIIEGSGRFVGEPPTGSIRWSADPVEDGVTINLVNVPAPQAAKTILGDILSVKYTVDPGIEGKITIQTPKPVAKTAVIDLFQSALRSNNAALVSKNGLYRIVPIDQAAVGATISVDDPGDFGGQIGTGVQVVQLKYVAASEMRRVLEPIAPRGGIVRTDDARNIITLSGNQQDIAAMMDAIALFDIDVMRGMSFALVPVKTSQPDTIAAELKTVFASEREGPMSGMVKFLPNQRLGAVLVISPQPRYLQRAETWIRRLDAQAQGNEKQLFTYSVQNRRAQELVEVLQSMFSTETGSKAPGGNRNVAPNYQAASLQSGTAQPATTSSVSQPASSGGFSTSGGFGGGGQSPARPQPAASAAPAITGTVQLGTDNNAPDGPRVKIVADDAENAILIEATNADYQRVLRVVSSLDVMPKQVLIEAIIAEVSLNDDLKFGIRSYMQSGKSSFTFSDAASGAVSSVFPGFSYALTAANVTATLNALNKVTDVNVVSSPSLTAMDNKPAVLQIGDQVPITTQSATSVLTTGAPVVNSVSYKDTGVILSITPRINKSGRVLLDIEQEVSTVASTTSSNIDSPTIRQRRIKTSVVLNDGDALVLGGLIQESKTVTRAQIPIFGDIPLIGNAGKYKDNEVGKTELIIIISPHVIRNIVEARRITEEYRDHLATRGPQKRPRSHNIEENMRRMLD
jgi:general secretion pathway protein D